MKSTGIAYLLWFFFGGIGAHKFYLGRPLVGGLYIVMFVLFWVGIIGLVAAGAEIIADSLTAIQQADPVIRATPQRISSPTRGGKSLLSMFMIAPLSLALLYDLITIPMQVGAANSRPHTGSAAKSVAAFDNDQSESERLAQIDQAIARYKAQRPMAASSPARVTAVARAGPPTFGKRR